MEQYMFVYTLYIQLLYLLNKYKNKKKWEKLISFLFCNIRKNFFTFYVNCDKIYEAT